MGGGKKQISNIISSKHQAEVNELKLIEVGGKKDKFTLVYSVRYKIDEDPVIVSSTEENHLRFTSKIAPTSQSYLIHIVILNGTGVTMANATLNILAEYNSVQSLVAVIVDHTSSNTGALNRLVVKLEKINKKRIHLLSCLLHQAELPLQYIKSELDGQMVLNVTKGVLEKLYLYKLFLNNDWFNLQP